MKGKCGAGEVRKRWWREERDLSSVAESRNGGFMKKRKRKGVRGGADLGGKWS